VIAGGSWYTLPAISHNPEIGNTKLIVYLHKSQTIRDIPTGSVSQLIVREFYSTFTNTCRGQGLEIYLSKDILVKQQKLIGSYFWKSCREQSTLSVKYSLSHTDKWRSTQTSRVNSDITPDINKTIYNFYCGEDLVKVIFLLIIN
jgi:hypothetical protein